MIIHNRFFFFTLLALFAISATMSFAGETPMDEPFRDPAGDVNYVRITPPVPRTESTGPAPSQSHVWIIGHWAWQNGFFWRSGQWSLKPSDKARWISGKWERQGTRNHGWRYQAGVWKS